MPYDAPRRTTFGFLEADLPKKTSFVLAPIADAPKPPRSVFTLAAGAAGHGSGIAIGPDGTVLRYRWAPQTKMTYQIVGSVSVMTLREMTTLARKAAKAPYVRREAAIDGGATGARFYDQTKAWQEVLLAQDGTQRGYLDSDAADAVLAWLLVLDREVPAWPPEQRSIRRGR